jgi:hypothetical protein
VPNFYTSTVAGNALDTNPGTFAQPFKTLAKLYNTLNAGDVGYIQGEFREDLIPLRNGASGNPITYTSYPGETAVISALDILSGWTLYSGNVWRTPMSWTLDNATQLGGNDQLFYRPSLAAEPVQIPECRWPVVPSGKKLSTLTWQDVAIVDSAVAGTGAANATVTSVITDSSLSELPDVVGACVTFFGGPAWVAISGVITAQTSTTISVAHPYRVGFHLKATNWYYIFGHQNLITQGSWFRNSDGYAYLWMPDNSSPNSWVIEAKKRDTSLNLFKNNLIVKDLKVIGGRAHGSNAASAANRIENVEFLYSGQRLFYANWYDYVPPTINANGPGSVVINCKLTDTCYPGIEATSSTVQNCTFENLTFAGASGAAIKLSGTGCVCSGNTVNGTGSARQIDIQSSAIISGNDLSHNSRWITDEAPIFCWRSTVGPTLIFNNYVHDSDGRLDDANQYYRSSIYVENVTGGFVIYKNRCKNAGGIALVPATGGSTLAVEIYNNTVDDSIFWQNTGFVYTGTIIKNNALTRISAKVGGTIRNDIVFTNNATSEVSYANNLYAADFLLDAAQKPSKNSPLVNAGIVISPYTDGYRGIAPDIGAMEYVPGFDLAESIAGFQALKVPKDRLTRLALLSLLAQ